MVFDCFKQSSLLHVAVTQAHPWLGLQDLVKTPLEHLNISQ